jgi:hypothetical protein
MRSCLAAAAVLLSFGVVALLSVAPAGARLAAPIPLTPVNGATTDGLPPFAWKAVAKAEQYEFEIAADRGFNSPVLGRGQDSFLTKNTRATLKKTVPNGMYWWHVRAITAGGDTSPWSVGRSFRKLWATTTNLQSPASGGSVVYPTTPLKLSWTPVPGARKYLVSIAYDPALGSLVPGTSSTAGPAETTATTFTRAAALAPGTYYWGVTPVDAEGNRGVRSPVSSFTWVWPSTTTPRVVDLDPAAEVFDPQFSWDSVLGAARYEVEVNASVGFAPGSKVCCNGTTINTSLSPTVVFKDNTLYWRVRAIDADGNAGVWNYGPYFTKAFDKVPPVVGTSIKNVHMRDNVSNPGADVDPVKPGYQTEVPVVTWDPVPGASSYEVDVTPYAGTLCDWASTQHHWRVNTAVAAWTPLGSGWFGTKPYSDPMTVATDIQTLVSGRYCVRVRARSDRSGLDEIYGDYTYLNPAGLGWAFEFTAYPSGGACSPSCTPDYLGSADYVVPQTGTTVTRTPYFTWKPLAGKQSYYVLVAKDPSFSNIVDYGFSQIPAYAPRGPFAPRTYSDESTLYYWAVLPATTFNGTGATGNPLAAAPQTFQKQSIPPTLMSPPNNPAAPYAFLSQPTFRWSPVLGARTYRLQVSQDPSFGNPIDDVTTDATAYSSNTTYPADTTLYWRVRANDENGIGLLWSDTGTFQKRLRTPALGVNPAGGDFIPTWSWAPVDGAVAYDVAADLPDGTHRDINGLRTPVLTPVLMYGTGIFSWRVRAVYPRSPFGTMPGPYTATHTFARTIAEPTGPRTDAAIDHVLMSWNPKPQVKGYEVQISGQPSFAQPIEVVRTDNTSYAPLLKFLPIGRFDTGHFYWRVAAIDEGNNVGDFTRVQEVKRTRRMRIVLTGSLRRRRTTLLVVGVKNFESGAGVAGAGIRITGAGMRARRVRTRVGGTAMVRVRPRRRGVVVFRATARGYRATSVSVRVR